MIQRVQTIWLLLAGLCSFAFTQVALFVGKLGETVIKRFIASENLLLFAIGIVTALLAIAAIFLFKNRKLQFRLAFLGMVMSIGLIALEVWQIEQFKTANSLLKGTYAFGSFLPIAMIVFFFLAGRNIEKDQKLVKSLDRLR